MPNLHPKPRRYIESLRGYTNPHVIKFDDGQKYVVKFKGNPSGDQVLINEYLAGEFIYELGFSGLRTKVVAVDAYFISNESKLKSANFKSGLQIGSPLIRKYHRDCADEYVPQIINRHELAQAIVFDTFFCNSDRHAGNVRLVFDDPNKKPSRFVLIDHSHVFREPGSRRQFSWTPASLKALVENDTAYVSDINFSNISAEIDSFEPFLLRLEALTPERIKEIVDSVPGDWVLSAAEKSALVEFLVARKSKVRTIINNHLTRLREQCLLKATTA